MESNKENISRYFSVIESLLFVTGDPLPLSEIANILEASENFTEEVLNNLIEIYENDYSRGIKVVKVNGAYQLVTKPINTDFVQKLLKTNVRQSLSQAALETLAIIAYKQPITRVEIEEIRGVKCDRALATLLEKKLVKENGRKDVVGRPILYVTSEEFLKHFDLESLGELPNLDEFDESLNDIEEDAEFAVIDALNSKE